MPLPRPAPGTTRWWVVGGLGITAAVALIVWFGLASANALGADVGRRVRRRRDGTGARGGGAARRSCGSVRSSSAAAGAGGGCW